MINHKKLNSIVTGLFIRGRKLKIFIVFITQPYFKVPKEIGINTTSTFVMKIPNKREVHPILTLKILLKFIKNVLKNHIIFLAIDTTLLSDNPLKFRKNLFK